MTEYRPRVYSLKCSLRGFIQEDELKFTRKMELAAGQINVQTAIISLGGGNKTRVEIINYLKFPV